MAAAGSKDAVFQSEFQATRLKMKKMISLMKEKLRPAAESLANDARRGGTDVEPAKGKKGKGASSSASAAADADAFEDDEALKQQIMERISKAGDVLAAAYEQLASFEVTKDVAQAMKANPEGAALGLAGGGVSRVKRLRLSLGPAAATQRNRAAPTMRARCPLQGSTPPRWPPTLPAALRARSRACAPAWLASWSSRPTAKPSRSSSPRRRASAHATTTTWRSRRTAAARTTSSVPSRAS